MILLDTQALVWMVEGDQRLGHQARKMIDAEEDLRISAMVAWEVAMLVRKQRLTLSKPYETWLVESALMLDMSDVAVTRDIAKDAGSLHGLHGDPCDRVMIATARALSCPLMTSDRLILDYAAEGHVQVIDARR